MCYDLHTTHLGPMDSQNLQKYEFFLVKNHVFKIWFFFLIRILVKSQTDRLKVMYMSPPCIHKGVLKNSRLQEGVFKVTRQLCCKICKNQTPSYMFASITNSTGRPSFKNLWYFFDQVTKDIKSMFTFEKWPLVAELKFKWPNLQSCAYFEFQLCH